MAHENIDVLVVGAGPVGLFCANELTRYGLTCRIIDKKSGLSEQSKALGIHIRTLDVFADCGLLDKVLHEGQLITGICFKSNGKILVNATFSELEGLRHHLIDLPQNKTEAIIDESLQQKGINVEWNTELTHLNQAPDEITATIRKPHNKVEMVNANWLIACDGAHSTVRHQVGAEFRGSAYKQAWWLADLLIDWNMPEHYMIAYITSKGPLACFPMGNKRYRIVMTAPTEHKEPTLEQVISEFNKRSSDTAHLSNPIWLSEFSIHHRQIRNYQYDRVFFAGDAAHIHSPMGGQGLNTGIQDIYNLVWKLSLVTRGNAKSDLLASYQAERFPVGYDVLRKTDLMTRMILLTNPLLIRMRNVLIRVLTSFGCLKNKIMKNLAELSISYVRSPIVSHSGKIRGIKLGEYIPAFDLLDFEKHHIVNSIELSQGTLHHLFLFSGIKTKKLPALMKLADRIQKDYFNLIQVHLIVPDDFIVDEPAYVLHDAKQLIHHHFGIKKPALFLVRPDKYIGYVLNPINEKKLFTYLNSLFITLESSSSIN